MTTKADWLRSEIEKFEGVEDKAVWASQCHNIKVIPLSTFTSIITRYKEELKVLEGK